MRQVAWPGSSLCPTYTVAFLYFHFVHKIRQRWLPRGTFPTWNLLSHLNWLHTSFGCINEIIQWSRIKPCRALYNSQISNNLIWTWSGSPWLIWFNCANGPDVGHIFSVLQCEPWPMQMRSGSWRKEQCPRTDKSSWNHLPLDCSLRYGGTKYCHQEELIQWADVV